MRDHHDAEAELHYLKNDMARIQARIKVVQQERDESMAELYGCTVEEYRRECVRIKGWKIPQGEEGRRQ